MMLVFGPDNAWLYTDEDPQPIHLEKQSKQTI